MDYLVKMSHTNENKKLKIAIEGNIASGKSTIINYLKNKIEHSNLTFDSKLELNMIQEPVKKWRNLNGANLLELMYKEPTKWAFPFHSYVQLTMLQNHLGMTSKNLNQNSINIMERSLYSARYCFVENIYQA